ncbi:MAG TPA: DUF6602 domain-containing protein [Bryobacteraceae bacterium]|nr:DUF6602 domain-containing protein [Bryobacteraceae bacterium]
MSEYRAEDRIDLHQVFLRVQEQMLADLAANTVLRHPTACGAATERRWIDLLNRFLPERYRATSAFIIDADGYRSRQIDLAIYDRFYSPLLFPDASQPYIPAESVYAVFEIKQTLGPLAVVDAGQKAASVRRLRRTSAPLLSAGSVYPPRQPAPILAGVLSLDASWVHLAERMPPLLGELLPEERLDLGCVLRQGAFESQPFRKARFSRRKAPSTSVSPRRRLSFSCCV